MKEFRAAFAGAAVLVLLLEAVVAVLLMIWGVEVSESISRWAGTVSVGLVAYLVLWQMIEGDNTFALRVEKESP